MSLTWRKMTAVLTLGVALATQQPVMAQTGDTANPHFNAYAQQLRQSKADDLSQRLKNLEQVRAALASLPADQQAVTPLVAFGVPAISSVKRMPDTVPSDGVVGRMIPAVAAKGEYSPLSFVVAPLKDVAKLEVRTAGLKGKAGSIAPAQVDIKVIKVWYQTGTAWHSYFADATKRVLVPELLLNDENLIRVDHQTQDNYLRVDDPAGVRHLWISAPPDVDNGKMNHIIEPVSDSRTLQPVTLAAGQSKQFWVTIHVPADAKTGVYQGDIELLAEGKVVSRLPLTLRVLPFELPLPRTYHDLDKPFLSMIYNSAQLDDHLKMSGGDRKLAEAKLLAELKNMREHNVFNHLLRGKRDLNEAQMKVLARNMELVKEAGFVPPLFGGFSSSGTVFFPKRNPERYEKYLKQAKAVLDLSQKILGHSEIYMFGFDEPGMSVLLAQQDGWRDLQALGAKIYSTSKDAHYQAVGFAENIANYAGNVDRDKSIKWNMIDHGVLNYAGPHVGPENPDFNRRVHGLLLYKAMFSGTGNYKYYDQHKIWNDFGSTQFRGFNMVYPTQTGVIDTMAWEGFRVGLDDVRYATLLKMLSVEAIKSNNVDVVYAGKKALQWLEQTDERNGDLEAMRMETINYILELRKLLGKDGD